MYAANEICVPPGKHNLETYLNSFEAGISISTSGGEILRDRGEILARRNKEERKCDWWIAVR